MSLALNGEDLTVLRDKRECQNDFQGDDDFLLGSGKTDSVGLAKVCALGRLCWSNDIFVKGGNSSGLICWFRVADRWWLVAGLRNVIWAFEPRRTKGPALLPLAADARFTNLFGGSCAGGCPPGERIGAADPWEKVMEGESGPTLDLMLSCWDNGRIDNLRIQELLEERESRASSAMGVAGENSPCLAAECRAPEDFGGVI